MNPLIAAKDNVEPNKSFTDEVGIASLNNLRRHSDSEDDGPLTVNVVLSSVQRSAKWFFPREAKLGSTDALQCIRPTEGGITSADAFRRIISSDVFPGITS